MASKGSFYQLSDELLLKIFSYLDILDLVLNVQHVDRHWNALVQDNSFWKDYVFTYEKQIMDEKLFQLLKNMPALRAFVVKIDTTINMVERVCTTCKFLTRFEVHESIHFDAFNLEAIVKYLPNIQHLAFPLRWIESPDAMKYSSLIQQLHELLSLKIIGNGFEARNCFFLKEIAKECPLLHEIDLQGCEFEKKDMILFLEAKKNVITKFFAPFMESAEYLCYCCSCKNLQVLHFFASDEEFTNTYLPYKPLFDFSNLKDLGMKDYRNLHFRTFLRSLKETTMFNLLKLKLKSSFLTACQFETILANCVNLRNLVLEKFHLDNGDAFKHIGKCIHLEIVEAPYCEITDEAVEIFSAKCRKLKHLDLSYSLITDYGLQCIMNCSELKVLKLNGTRITGENFHLIPLHLTKLCKLYIQNCLRKKNPWLLQKQMPCLQVYENSFDDVMDMMENSMSMMNLENRLSMMSFRY